MKEYDFLTPFEAELERESNVSHKLEGEEREIFIAMMEDLERRDAMYRRRVTTIQNPEKRQHFEELEPYLIHLAVENCANLRIYDEENGVVRVELKFLNIIGGNDEHAIHGEILGKIFEWYRDFSLGLTPDNYILLTFQVPLVDEVFVK